eukprot:GSChrysophyteH1.ASY1.ANO1.1290.1 assembled CDS
MAGQSRPWLVRYLLITIVIFFIIVPIVTYYVFAHQLYRGSHSSFDRENVPFRSRTKTSIDDEHRAKSSLVDEQRLKQDQLEQEIKKALDANVIRKKPQNSEKNVLKGKTSTQGTGAAPSPAPTRPLKPWQLRQLEEDKQEFQTRELEKDWIRVLPTPKKTQIKQDREVMLRTEDIEDLQRTPGFPTNIVGQPRGYLSAIEVLRKHPLFEELRSGFAEAHQDGFDAVECSAGTVCETMLTLSKKPECAKLPIFLTMASVGDELYWQLIENFVYTAVKFNFVQCSLVICVNDDYCMRLCRDSLFPCYDYRRPSPTPEQQEKYHLSVKPSVMESIAELKLFHIPQALLQGVNTFMLDLDVGFLNDPRHMIRPFNEVPTIDIFVQLDYLFIMNRTKAGWKQWFTEPLPNIGLLLCRGNNKTYAVFEHAWKKYQKMIDSRVRELPGKDQNHVLDGIRVGRGTNGLRFAYFSNSTAPLMDKIVQKWRGIELGGQPAANLFTKENTIAIHTTCYEQSTKVMGLKATNAFWNPLYYDPLKPTITKQIFYQNEEQVRDEVRSLVWLAMSTKRALIAPNLVGPDDLIPTSPTHDNMAMWPGFRVTFLKRAGAGTILKQNALSVEILEPAFYWRVQRDYDDVPEPYVILFSESDRLSDIRNEILKAPNQSRIVLQHRVTAKRRTANGLTSLLADETPLDEKKRMILWAKDSVGKPQLSYKVENGRYGVIPSVKGVRQEPGVADVLQGMRTCKDVFQKLRGNRTCFQVCD